MVCETHPFVRKTMRFAAVVLISLLAEGIHAQVLPLPAETWRTSVLVCNMRAEAWSVPLDQNWVKMPMKGRTTVSKYSLVDPFSPLHHQCTAWMFSGWSSRRYSPIPLGSMWSGTMSL